MIDSVLELNEHVARTSFGVREGNVLVEDGYFTESGMIENIAQTGALQIGFS